MSRDYERSSAPVNLHLKMYLLAYINEYYGWRRHALYPSREQAIAAAEALIRSTTNRQISWMELCDSDRDEKYLVAMCDGWTFKIDPVPVVSGGG